MVRVTALLLAAVFALAGQKIDVTKQVKGSLPVANGGTARTTLCPNGESLTVAGGVWGCADLEEEAHAAEHQHGGADEIATATSGANAVPKAEADGDLNAAWIGQDQAYDWTGASTFTALQDKGSQVFDVRAYGAVCDDATDDLTAVNSAVSAAVAAGGGVVFFPEGVCRVSGVVAVTSGSVVFRGAGRGITTVKTTSATADVFDFDGVGTIGDVGVERMTINASTARTAGRYVEMDNVLRAHVRDVRFQGAFQAVHVGNASAIVWMDRLEARDTVATGVSFVVDGFSVEVHFVGVVADAPVGTQPVTGIQIKDAEGIWVTNVDMIHQGIGLLVNPGAGETVNWLFVVNSSFDSGDGQGISIDATNATAVIQGATFTSCWTSTNDSHGVIVNNSGSGTLSGMRFLGHRSFNNAGHGFLLNGGTELWIADSSIAGNSRGSSGTNHGITVASNLSGFSLIGNRSGPHAGFSNTQGWGIILLGGTTDNYVISGNDARGNVTGGIFTDNIGVSKQSIGNLPVGDGGDLVNASHALSKLGSAANGAQVYCSDCLKGSDPCTGSSTGAMAFRVNGAWQCL